MNLTPTTIGLCVFLTVIGKGSHTATAQNTTSSPNESTIQILDVSDDSFVVKFDAITGAANYVVCYYLGDVTNNTVSNSTSVTITDVSPLENEYLVAIAYMIPTQSAFTNNVSTMIWNFNETLNDSIILSWRTFVSPGNMVFYLYSVLNPDNSQHAVHNVVNPTLTAENLLPATTYAFVVSASILSGASITSTSAPTLFSFLASSDSVSVRWDNVEGAESYESTVYEPTTGSIVGDVVGVGTHDVNNAILINLTNGQCYTFEVCAVNSAGKSCGNISINGPLPTPNPPIVVSVTQTSFNLTYDNVDGATIYNILVEDPSGNVLTNFNTSENDVLISDLTPGIAYNVSLSVIFPAGSSPKALLSQITAPPNVAGINVTSRSSTSLSIEYLQSLGSDRYDVTVTSSSGVISRFTSIGLTALATGLVDGTPHSITVVAINSAGSSQPSRIIHEFTRSISPPELFFSNATTSSFDVRWDAQRPNLPTTKYVLSVVPSSFLPMPTLSLPSVVYTFDTEAKASELEAGTEYTVTIQTQDVFGFSPLATHANYVTLPNLPTNLTAFPGDFSLNISSEAVVGASFYTFKIPLVETISSANPLGSFDGLRSGATYNITATATKTTSYGNFTSTVVKLTAATTRSIPKNVIVSDIQPTQFNVSWDAIQGADGYLVNVVPLENLTPVVAVVSGTALTVGGLKPGIIHNVTVQGTYETGIGSKSKVVQQITAPDLPKGISVQTVTADEVTLFWNQVSNATNYRALYAEGSSMTYLNTTVDVTNATISGLQNATLYKFMVIAINGIFESDQSSEVQQITATLTPIFLLKSTTQTTILATWNSPTGAAMFTVKVVIGTTSPIYDQTINTNSIKLTFTDGIRPGTNYTICVSAQTSSLSSGGVTSSAESCIFLVTAPADPSAPLDITSTSNSLHVVWNAADGATDYELVVVE
ncbi:unnamed protein product [Clavelina lepadiformis]|uniref:Fibronectin type-III domain-containing protein n=1 Tax=Clavelina lepadiformis TaxID=159417 RepID=A0ABP0GGS2_CLALP